MCVRHRVFPALFPGRRARTPGKVGASFVGHRQAVPDEAGASLLGRSGPSAWKQRREDQSLPSVAEAVDKPGRTASAATDPPRQSVQVAVLAQSSQHRLRSASPTDLRPFSEVQSAQLVGTGMAQSPNISQHRKVTLRRFGHWCSAPTHDQPPNTTPSTGSQRHLTACSPQEGETVNGSSRCQNAVAPMGSDPWLSAGTRRPTRTPRRGMEQEAESRWQKSPQERETPDLSALNRRFTTDPHRHYLGWSRSPRKRQHSDRQRRSWIAH